MILTEKVECEENGKRERSNEIKSNPVYFRQHMAHKTGSKTVNIKKTDRQTDRQTDIRKYNIITH